MPEIGVRDLKAHASEIIRKVRERRSRYLITYRGRPVAVLSPIDEAKLAEVALGGDPAHIVWETLSRLGEEIGRGWRSPKTSAELLSDMRR
ncbi:MAG TPA: type II toxin-antitoxin system Phd/YefM family antitoxin [Anaerolineales bacterium]|nr:type II toxin-antitoxin system Phd/YefM family antitoxin [Anaerolineales bacterium]